jgi:hypothetical protein
MQVNQPITKSSLSVHKDTASVGHSDEGKPSFNKPSSVKDLLLSAEGGCYLSAEAAKLLGISEQKLQELSRTDKIIGLPIQDGGQVYPKWQFTKRFPWGYQILRGLDEVLAKFPSKSPWMRAGFMLNNISVDMASPLAGLKAGKISQVIDLVNNFGEHGAA